MKRWLLSQTPSFKREDLWMIFQVFLFLVFWFFCFLFFSFLFFFLTGPCKQGWSWTCCWKIEEQWSLSRRVATSSFLWAPKKNFFFLFFPFFFKKKKHTHTKQIGWNYQGKWHWSRCWEMGDFFRRKTRCSSVSSSGFLMVNTRVSARKR